MGEIDLDRTPVADSPNPFVDRWSVDPDGQKRLYRYRLTQDPMADFVVDAYRPRSKPGQIAIDHFAAKYTGDDGHYRFRIPPGNYHFRPAAGVTSFDYQLAVHPDHEDMKLTIPADVETFTLPTVWVLEKERE